jgi:hypothetical protein
MTESRIIVGDCLAVLHAAAHSHSARTARAVRS